MTNDEFFNRLDVIFFHVFALPDTSAMLQTTMERLEENGYIDTVTEIRVLIRYYDIPSLQAHLAILQEWPKINIISISNDNEPYPEYVQKYFKPDFAVYNEYSLGSDISIVSLLMDPNLSIGLDEYDQAMFIHMFGVTHSSEYYDSTPVSCQGNDINTFWGVLADPLAWHCAAHYERKAVHLNCNCFIFDATLLQQEFSLERYLLNSLYIIKTITNYDSDRKLTGIETILQDMYTAHTIPFTHMDDDGVYITNKHGICGLLSLIPFQNEFLDNDMSSLGVPKEYNWEIL